MRTLLIIALALLTWTCPLLAQQPSPGQPGVFSITDFGAVGDATTDNTSPIQQALQAAGTAGGGVVFIPTGNYLVKGHLVVPQNVTLEGVFRGPTARSQMAGSTLLAVEGKGSEEGEPFLMLHPNACLKGMTVFYPEQNTVEPVPYPWCVRGMGDNVTILDTLLVNPWKGVDFMTNPCGRHLIRGLYGQPLKLGLAIDFCLDCGRLEDIHFWPFWSEELIKWTHANGTAFLFGRTDWEMLNGVFCLGYKVGFHCTSLGHDAPHLLATNSGADFCATALLVDYVQVQAGLQFTNCMLNGGVVVGPGNPGPLYFNNCNFYAAGTKAEEYLQSEGQSAMYVLAKGPGRLVFTGCQFYYPWGPWKTPELDSQPSAPAIWRDGGGLTLTGCDFTEFPLPISNSGLLRKVR